MTLVFDNRTPFEALRFETLDQFDQGFHVFVAKVSYALDAPHASHPDGAQGLATLSEMDTPGPLIVEDEYWGDLPCSSVRCESDLAPYKPRCDVIVNATAHAPGGTPTPRFEVRLRVRTPDSPAPLPEPPRGLNPFQQASAKDMADWRRAVEHARAHPVGGTVLIDKRLIITGERGFTQHAWPFHLFWRVVKWASLGFIRRTPWTLTAPQKLTELPLRYEYAYGGQCRVNQDDAAARRVGETFRLTPEQRAQHPDQTSTPVAHTVYEQNPLGLGYTHAWHLQATQPKRMAAPQIELPAVPMSATLFWQAVSGKARIEAAGLGCVGRAWLPRRALIGAIEIKDHWGDDEIPGLPPEFDHGYWNAAPIDQQCPHLQGDEHFTLTNLCAPDHSAATLDVRRQTQLCFQLPGALLYLALGDAAGRIAARPLVIDTVLIDPAASRVDVTWRAVISTRVPLTDVQLRIARTADERQRVAALLDEQRNAAAQAPPQVPTDSAEVNHGA